MLKAQGLLPDRQARAADAYSEIRRSADLALLSPRRMAASTSYETGRGFSSARRLKMSWRAGGAAMARFRAVEAAIGAAAVALLDRVCLEHVIPVG